MNKIEINKKLTSLLEQAAKKLNVTKKVVLIESKGHSDFASNIALGSKEKSAMSLANEIVKLIEKDAKKIGISEIKIVEPGFINFFISDNSLVAGINEIIKQGSKYGSSNLKGNLNVEFVSANPTGYLHIGHARNAAIGSAVANICEFAGINVTREYYINDAGNQISVLAQSVFARYQQIWNKKYPMPEESYGGQDIIWAAKEFEKKYGDKFKNSELKGDLLEKFKLESTKLFLEQIEIDLKKFGVWFDRWFSEKSLYENDQIKIKEVISNLKNTYKKDGALWLKTSLHGDDKDRVLIKSNGELTYFTPDIAYHNIKFHSSGKDPVIMNVWGADHSGYIKRMKCAMEDLGYDPEKLVVLCMQLVRLVKNGEEFKMSKRKGTAFWLREFVDLVGVDSVRFILLDRTYDSKLDFDLNVATSKTNDNPVILVQYANARAHQLLTKASKDFKNLKATELTGKLDEKLVSTLLEFPEVVTKSATKYLTHLITQYLIKLAKEFNSWYSNSDKIVGSKNEESLMALAKAVNITLENGLKLLGISAPEKM